MIHKNTFASNGLLSDDEEGGGIPFDSHSKQQSFSSTQAFVSSTSSISGLETNGLLDDTPNETSEDDAALSTVERMATGLPLLRMNTKSILDDSQEDLPSLSQLLPGYKNRKENTSSNVDTVHSYSAESIKAISFDGKPIVLRKRSRVRAVSRNRPDTRKGASLLETPVYKMMEQLSRTSLGETSLTSSPDPSSSTKSGSTEKELWVDRYRPCKFSDLLGDERVHRETMMWLKEWDHCVYGKRKTMGRPKTPVGQANDRYEDSYHRPRERILLLSGPAGYGKTTLAHVAARQAGYEVMEINASDARSGQVIDDRIRPALESGSTVGKSRPVCVVIDEIDGATGSGDNSSTFIHKLVGLTFDKGKKKGRGDKGKDVHRPLLRPIICICNDLYASSLTKLRQHARIIRFSRPADIHLTKRLRTICENEGLRADSRALTALVGVTRGDLRGCLNTLQFIKARNQEVTEPIVRSATAGIKENDSSFTSILSSLFAPLPKKRVKELGLSEQDELRYAGRLSSEVESSGSVDRVAVGCFEHYMNLRHYDASLTRHSKAANWLATFDMFSGIMRSEREYGLLPYLPYSLVPFYPLFSERGGSKVERPKVDWENLQRMRVHEEIYKSLAKGVQSAGNLSVGLRHMLANDIMQLELAPMINRIITPPIRPVNSQVTKPKEKALLARLVEIMVSFDLHLVQERAEDGQLTFRLDPPLEAFITYEGKRASDVAVPRYATRQLIAAELEAKLIARQADITERSKTKTATLFKSSRKAGDDQSANGKRKAVEIDPADKPPVDFFGRPIKIAPTSKKSKTVSEKDNAVTAIDAQRHKISFRYNEGNSAAVRKPIKVSAFL